jgi:hypothetical protein
MDGEGALRRRLHPSGVLPQLFAGIATERPEEAREGLRTFALDPGGERGDSDRRKNQPTLPWPKFATIETAAVPPHSSVSPCAIR